jgi:Sugar (and other) transporter
MISGISYGTYLIFGILTFMGAGFVWFFVPETKRLTLEEMDVIFGSEGTAQADFERMEEINKEIGLDTLLRGAGSGGSGLGNGLEKEGNGDVSEKDHLETTGEETSPEVKH